MEARAMHDFVPQEPASELAFRRGDRLLILDYGLPVEWYHARLNGRTGLVPGNYIEIDPTSSAWYFGKLPRSTAEHMLQGNRNDGAFLVRISESSPNDFSLSVKSGDGVQHFRIMQDEDHKYFLWSSRFNSLNELVNHYRTETVSRSQHITLVDMNTDNQFVARALYNFDPGESQDGSAELAFTKGELITVFDNQDENWWGGSIGDRSGYFPATYVEQFEPATQNQAHPNN